MAPPIQPLLPRFEKFFKKTDGCWNWTSTKSKRGYGKFWFKDRQVTAHRMSLFLYKNIPLEKIEMACHHCDNTLCVNPDHLYVGNGSTNQKDSVARKRHKEIRKTHCPKGHIYDKENTYFEGSHRHCKICMYLACKNVSVEYKRAASNKAYRKRIGKPLDWKPDRTKCPQGHTESFFQSNRGRRCRICVRETNRKAYLKRTGRQPQ